MGPHKTGTSSIQAFLLLGAPRLGSLGVLVGGAGTFQSKELQSEGCVYNCCSASVRHAPAPSPPWNRTYLHVKPGREVEGLSPAAHGRSFIESSFSLQPPLLQAQIPQRPTLELNVGTPKEPCMTCVLSLELCLEEMQVGGQTGFPHISHPHWQDWICGKKSNHTSRPLLSYSCRFENSRWLRDEWGVTVGYGGDSDGSLD